MLSRSALVIRSSIRARAPRPAFGILSSLTAQSRVLPNFAARRFAKKIPAISIPLSRGFSTSLPLGRPSGTVDEELLAKLDQEIAVEADLGEYDQMPGNLKEFLGTTQFKLNDAPGKEEVELIRRFGDETIRVVFSIADLNAIDEKLDDPALYGEEELPETADDVSKTGKDGASNTQSAQAVEDEDQEYEDAGEPAYPARLNITIEKSTSGALQVEAVAQDGMVIIENVHFHQSAELATAQTAEADWERRGHYVGPPFGNLDEDLQMYFERYLDERGINTALALFVPDYIDFKEQREYITWLKNVKSFVAA